MTCLVPIQMDNLSENFNVVLDCSEHVCNYLGRLMLPEPHILPSFERHVQNKLLAVWLREKYMLYLSYKMSYKARKNRGDFIFMTCYSCHLSVNTTQVIVLHKQYANTLSIYSRTCTTQAFAYQQPYQYTSSLWKTFNISFQLSSN